MEQGLLTGDELERALTEQQATGQRLGETIVKLGFVSGPELASALAAQYGIELATEKGFGTGLRSEIQRRHESDRRRVVQLVPNTDADPASDSEPETEAEILAFVPAPEPSPEPGDVALLAQLEEQWAKLAAAEAALAERETELRELAESRERELTERTESLERELDALTEREHQLTELAENRRRELADLAESRERDLAERAELERRLAELADHSERERDELTERHGNDLRRLEELNERLREEVEELRSAPPAPEPDEVAPVVQSSHLLFVQLDERYELVSREGPPPLQFTPLSLPDVDDGTFVAAGLRASPLPGDERPCVVVHRG